MALELSLKQRVACDDVVQIAKQACEAILRVYNSEVREARRPPQFRLFHPPPLAPPATAATRCNRDPMHHVQAGSWDVERKADDSPLTRADREANTVICDGLARIGGCSSGGGSRGGCRSLLCHLLPQLLSSIPD